MHRDRAKPGLIAVDSNGQHFVNEAVSYHEFVRAQLAHASSAISTFGRGSNVYQRSLGDWDQQSNPCVAPLRDAPFYAIAV